MKYKCKVTKKTINCAASNRIEPASTTSKDWGHVVAGKGGKTLNADIPVKTAQNSAVTHLFIEFAVPSEDVTKDSKSD